MLCFNTNIRKIKTDILLFEKKFQIIKTDSKLQQAMRIELPVIASPVSHHLLISSPADVTAAACQHPPRCHANSVTARRARERHCDVNGVFMTGRFSHPSVPLILLLGNNVRSNDGVRFVDVCVFIWCKCQAAVVCTRVRKKKLKRRTS